MPDRTRPIRKEICLNEQELSMVRHKMNQLGTRNFGAYTFYAKLGIQNFNSFMQINMRFTADDP